MRAITLWQPWASAIAAGLKHVETRSWAPPQKLLDQRIAIHAARRPFGINSATAEVVRDLPLSAYRRLAAFIGSDPEDTYGWDEHGSSYPLGCVVATATLRAAFPTEHVEVHGWEDDALPAWGSDRRLRVGRVEALLGDYSPGRWAWLLTDVEPLPRPAPARGAQGFWTWSP